VAGIEHVTPNRLYRYRSLEHFDREIDAIEKRYLYCPHYLALNDPMEGLFDSSRNLRAAQSYREVRDEVIGNKAALRLCSFSEVKDHELMWAHYADQFRGICISYRLSRLLDNLKGNVSFTRMFYNESVPTIHRSKKSPSDLAKMVLSYKSYRWSYEREWRMFCLQERASYKDQCISSVYLGSRMDDRTKQRLVAKLAQLKIKMRQVVIGKYFIDFKPV
jgi:Protein of unknown function (DUF2971)